MYDVFNRVPSTLQLIVKVMIPYIEKRGKMTLMDNQAWLKDPIEFTKKLLDLKKEMDDLLDYSFKNN